MNIIHYWFIKYAEKDRNGVPVIKKKNRNGVPVRSGSKRTLSRALSRRNRRRRRNFFSASRRRLKKFGYGIFFLGSAAETEFS